jgi:sirohydrochlorin cobaltochelatase
MSVQGTALLLFSHGSVMCGADRLLRVHADRLRGPEYPIVECGFLNYSEPSFEEAVERCRTAGARRIVVLPYFLVAGKFVTDDLPPRIEAARMLHPELQFEVASALLDEPLLAQAIIESADRSEHVIARSGADLPNAEDCELRPRCPLYQTHICPGTEP